MKSRVSLRVETLGKLFNKYSSDDSNDIYDIGEIEFAEKDEDTEAAEKIVSSAASKLEDKKKIKPLELQELNQKLDSILDILSSFAKSFSENNSKAFEQLQEDINKIKLEKQ